MCCLRCRAAVGINSEGKEGIDASTIDLNTVVEPRTFYQLIQVTHKRTLNTKRCNQLNCKGFSSPSQPMQH